jgi:hypothetical protein
VSGFSFPASTPFPFPPSLHPIDFHSPNTPRTCQPLPPLSLLPILDDPRTLNNTPHTGQRHHFRHRAASTAQSRDVGGDHTRFHVCNLPSLNLSPERASCAGQREDQGEEPPDVAPTVRDYFHFHSFPFTSLYLRAQFADEVNPTVSRFPSAPYRVFSESIALEIGTSLRSNLSHVVFLICSLHRCREEKITYSLGAPSIPRPRTYGVLLIFWGVCR